MRGGSNRQILALIPARGGSKGIPRKNLVAVAGKPLIAHSIGQALGSRYVTRTIVSTDDEEIAQVARSYGAEVPFMRPAELAQDDSTDLEAFRHALGWLIDNEKYECELVVHLRPTGPVRRIELIDRAIERMLANPRAHSLRSVSWPVQTPYKMWWLKDGLLHPLVTVDGLPEAHSTPRQKLPEVWWQNGYVDVVRPEVILEMGSMAGEHVIPFIVDEPLMELDYPESIPLVEQALIDLEKGLSPKTDPRPPRHPV